MRTARLAPALLLAALGCDDESLSRVRAELDVPEAIDFGDVQVGIERTIRLDIENRGGARAVITSVEPEAVTFSGTGHAFRVDHAGFTVQPSEVFGLELGFRPFAAAEAPYESKLTLVTDEEPITVIVRGRGVDSGLLVSPNPVDFGSVLTGSTKRIDVTVTNSLSEAVRLTARVSGGTVALEEGGDLFRVDAEVAPDGLLAELQPGASIDLPVEYAPVAADQPDRGRFLLSNCESDLCEVSVSLLGRGASFALACTPGSLDFGAVHPGVTRTMTASCQNVAGAAVTIAAVGLTPGTASEYALLPPAVPVELGAGESVEVTVEYTPTQSTYDTGAMPGGAIEIESLDPAGRALDPVQIALSGRAGGPSIAVLPSALDFGMIALGTSHEKRFLVINDGFDDLLVSSVDPDTAGTAAFTADRAGFLVPAGSSTVVEVTFSPLAEGSISSALLLSSNDAIRPMLVVPLFGRGVDLPPCAYEIAPPSLNFGVVMLGDAPVLSTAVENVGSNDCLVNDIDIIEPAFTATGTFVLVNGAETGIIIAPGTSHDIPVRYTPVTGAGDRGTLGFYINDPRDSNPEVELFGTGESVLEIECPPPVTTAVGTPVTLDAIAQVAGANITGYRWTIGSAPTGGIGTPGQWTPDPPNAASETFLPYIVGTYDLLVEVFDDDGGWATCTTQVIAEGEGLVVTLTWDGPGDVDLHVHNQNPTPWFGADDCYYGNSAPLWDLTFPPGQGANPALDFDNTIADGPENTRVSTVLLGQPYTIGVHNFAAAAGRVATLDIFCGGVITPTYTATSAPLQGSTGGDCTANDFWRVATVTFSSASQCTVTPIDTYAPSAQACTTF